MNRIVHFEVHAENPQRAMKFYTDLFGWEFMKWGEMDYWMTKTGEKSEMGIDGGLLLRKGPAPVEGQAVNAFVCTMMTDKLDEMIAQIPANGGTVAVPKYAIATMGWIAYFKDTEGNLFGLMQADTNAK